MAKNKTSASHRINEAIRAPQVRLIGAQGDQLGIVSMREALQAAKDAKLDLVEISPNADPPVVKITDYGKMQFQHSKKLSLAKKKQHRVKVKEVKFRPNTDKGDYEVKLRNLRGFLEAGHKVKITVQFRGREITHHELGANLLERLKADLVEYGKIEFEPKLEGRYFTMIVAPKTM